MEFSELKATYDNVRRLIIKKHKESKALEVELANLSKEAITNENNYQKYYAAEKRKAMEEYRKKLSQPIEARLLKSEERLEQLNKDYAEELAETTEENIAQDYSDEQDILAEVKESASVLQERLQKSIGTKFYTALINYLEDNEIELSDENLESVVQYFNECSTLVAKMNDKPGVVGEALDHLESTIMSMGGGALENDNKLSGILLVALVVATIFAYKFVFPIYVIFLLLLATFNVFRSYKIYKIMVVQKAVVDNLAAIESLVHEKVVAEVARQTKEINDFYTAEIDKTKREVEKTRSEFQQATMAAENSFVFDDSRLRMDYEANNKRREIKEVTLTKNKSMLNKELEELYTKETALKKQLDGVVDSIQSKYLDFSKIGTDVIFNPRFLFDVDSTKSKPIFFEHPETSFLMLYQDFTDVTNFVRLINAQLRTKLNPFSLSVSVYDPVNLGQAYILYAPQTGKVDMSRAFKIMSKEEEVKEYVVDERTDMIKRSGSVGREFKNVGDYNKRMVELESLTLPYEFFFLIDPSSNLLADSDLLQIMRNGGNFGIFTHVFISINKFKALGDTAESLLESIGKTYVLQSGNYAERAKQYIMDTYLTK